MIFDILVALKLMEAERTGFDKILEDYKDQEDNIACHTDAKPGESGIRRQMAPIKYDGQQLCKDNPHGGNPHQGFYRVDLSVLSAPDLHSPDASMPLPPLLDEINYVKHRQNE